MQIFLRFPDFKEKVVTLSYDDGVVYDEKLISIIKKYGIKCTFNLNSGLFSTGRRLNLDCAKKLYSDKDFEVALHGKEHLFLTNLSFSDAFKEISEDKVLLENAFGTVIRGMAYAYGVYNDETVRMLKEMGIVYSRTCNDSLNFSLPNDWLRLRATCHHTNPKLFEFLDAFIKRKPNDDCNKNPLMFYLWGHSFEFNDNNNWDVLDRFCDTVVGDKSVWKATNIELYDYVSAFNSLSFSADGKMILNNSNVDIFLLIDNDNVLVSKNSTTKI